MQVIKLGISTAGSEVLIGADAANGLDVDVTRIIPGTTATALGKAEDAVAASGDTGVFVLAVRRDTPVADGANGDYVGLHVDSLGCLQVSGTHLEDEVSGSDSPGRFMLGIRRDTPVADAGDGNFHGLELDASGRLWVSGTFAEDAAHASGHYGHFVMGVQSLTRTARAADGDYTPFGVGAAGEQFSAIVPEANASWAATNYAALAAASGVIKASAGKLLKVTLTNDNAAARYFQFFNLTAVPADTTVPLFTVKLGIGETKELHWEPFGKYFATGICWCNSTTGATKTIGAADSYVEVIYL